MKTASKTSKLIVITLVLCMIALGATAQKPKGDTQKEHKDYSEQEPPSSPNHPAPPPPPPPPPADLDGAPGMPPPFFLPDLTDLQKEKIKQAGLKNTAAMTPLKNQVREKKARLATLLAEAPVNLNAADQMADEIGKLGAAILKQQIRHDQDIRAVLTPDQQILFDAKPKPFLNKMMPGKKGKMDKRGKGQRP